MQSLINGSDFLVVQKCTLVRLAIITLRTILTNGLKLYFVDFVQKNKAQRIESVRTVTNKLPLRQQVDFGMEVTEIETSRR